MKKILTIIFDGFGMRDEEKGNAIKSAKMNNFENLWKEYPHSLLEASGIAVGLNEGQEGNSEIGHLTIGSGRVLRPPEILVNEFLTNPDLENKAVQELLKFTDRDINIMGLCSDGNVHAGIDDFLKMYQFLIDKGFTKIHFHLITDGRDTSVHSAYKYIKMINDKIAENNNVGNIATVCGRYYAMDRDENWNLTKIYYDLITAGKGQRVLDVERSIKNSYENNITDEFIKPIVLSDKTIKNDDVLIWMNYRADRSKQILNAIVNSQSFTSFAVKDLSNVAVFSFFPIDKKIKTINFLEQPNVTHSLGLYLSELDFTQARIAESEKFPHVTYFFDGGYDGKINKCDKFQVPSLDVATYDMKPEMSCVEVTKRIVSAMNNDYDFILANFANPDMVGHTGNMEATIKACMAIDICLGKIMEKAEENFYKVIILSDHGNAEKMINEDGSICTTHTLSQVPFLIVDKKIKLKENGSLVNVAPTILDYMDIAIPSEMQETESLIIEG